MAFRSTAIERMLGTRGCCGSVGDRERECVKNAGDRERECVGVGVCGWEREKAEMLKS
jgi:hypothetical protein